MWYLAKDEVSNVLERRGCSVLRAADYDAIGVPGTGPPQATDAARAFRAQAVAKLCRACLGFVKHGAEYSAEKNRC